MKCNTNDIQSQTFAGIPSQRSLFILFRRDVRKALCLRTLLIWIALAALGLFFFSATGGKTKLNKYDQIEFMSLFLPHMIFGSWAVLSSYFDLFSADREHNVLDCILCSGIRKNKLFLSKLLTMAVVSLVLAMLYLLPITAEIIAISGNLKHLLLLTKYLFPLWGYIMVYASLGIIISILARSTKLSLIVSLAIGLLLMPRLFVMMVEGVGNLLHWSLDTVHNVSMIAPGVMLQALSEKNDTSHFLLAASIFTISIFCLLTLAYLIFSKQDEYNYGE